MAFNLCKYVWDRVASLCSSSPCTGHRCSWMHGLIHIPYKAPLTLAAESVWVKLQLFLKETWTHTQHWASNEEPGQESSALRQTAHIFTISSLFFLFFFPLSLSNVTTERGSGMCGWLSKLTRLSERNESSGRLPKTTAFRSRSQFLYKGEFWLPIIGEKKLTITIFIPPCDVVWCEKIKVLKL